MPNGYWQKLLRIDLSTGTRSVEPLAEADLRRFIGGAGLGAVHNTTTTVNLFSSISQANRNT